MKLIFGVRNVGIIISIYCTVKFEKPKELLINCANRSYWFVPYCLKSGIYEG